MGLLTPPIFLSPQCAALVGEDQPLCPDLPELDLSELDVSDLDADSFLGGLKWYSDQSEIISSQYGNEASNLFEVREHIILQLVFIFPSLSAPLCPNITRFMTRSLTIYGYYGSLDSCSVCIFLSRKWMLGK